MNSMEEKALFESWGWVYNYIARKWVSPIDERYVITQDALVMYSDTPETEEQLRGVIAMYGKKET